MNHQATFRQFFWNKIKQFKAYSYLGEVKIEKLLLFTICKDI